VQVGGQAGQQLGLAAPRVREVSTSSVKSTQTTCLCGRIRLSARVTSMPTLLKGRSSTSKMVDSNTFAQTPRARAPD